MIRTEALQELRYVLDAPAADEAWQDSTLLGYLEEGQDVFCERTGYFRDATNFAITLEAGTQSYAIPDRVIEVMSIWDGTRKLKRDDTGNFFEGTIAAGKPYRWQVDQDTGMILFDREPSSDEDGDSYTLRVWRYSLYALTSNDIDGSGTDASLEIPSRFHRAPIEWAAYKAFNHRDMDYQDPIKAADHLKMFKHYVSAGKQAMRRYHGITARVGTNPCYRT